MATAFRFEYQPGTITYGDGCVASLAEELTRMNCARGLVVCGRTVGSTPAVIDPVTDGLGDRLAGVFDDTTPDKRFATAVAAAEQFHETAAETFVAVGGGSSLDVAKVASIVTASDRSPSELGTHVQRTGSLPVPAGRLPPVVAIPTTLAGADLSQMAGFSADPASGLVDEPARGGISDPRLLPAVLFYDPALVATTPREILAGSAMNGFDKGIETLYARNGTPLTDGTAIRGLSLLCAGLPTLTEDRELWAMDDIVQGIMLVQYGISRPEGTTLSLIHAFGHGLKAHATIQQGIAHAVIVPHALAYLFENVDGRRALLAEGLGVQTDVKTDGELAAAIVDAVSSVRDALGLPDRLRDIDGVERSALPAMAATTAADSLLDNAPVELNPTETELHDVLETAW